MANGQADDRFERFYAEKLWELVPSIHRHEDGLGEHPGTLRAIIELIAEQAALLRRSHDRLWEDAFIDGCDDWAVPYIGDLVATRLISALNPRGRRIDVANTIYYRRRKGTPRVLEELIADITDWDGKVVESFRYLARAHHRLDPAPRERLEPARGFADLRQPRLTELAESAWDPFAHTADLRKSRGRDGRWNIPKLTFHLFRLGAYPIRGVKPHARADGQTFTFDPSGRDVGLFMPKHRGAGTAWDDWRSAAPWEVPAPMRCRILGHAEYVVTEELRAERAAAGMSGASVDELSTIVGLRFASEHALRSHLSRMVNAVELLSPGNWDAIRAGALVAECGKVALWPEAVAVSPAPAAPVPRERMAAGTLATFGALPGDVDVVVDPDRGRFELAAPPPVVGAERVSYVYGFGGEVGAGGYDRRAYLDVPDLVVAPAPPLGGTIAAADLPVDATTLRVVGVTAIPDSATYTPVVDPVDVEAWTLQAANFERPYISLADDWIFTAAAGLEATLVLDGLWLGARAARDVVLRGAWSRIVLRSMTLDPGGVDIDNVPLTPVRLWVEGQVDVIEIDHSIVASVAPRGDGVIDRIVVRDSILDARNAGGTAIDLAHGELELRRVTVLGDVDVERLDASDSLIAGLVDVTDTQAGCFRFSAAAAGSRLPHPYRHVEWPGGPIFASTRFGDAGYTWLADSAPTAIRRGGEHGLEMGVWNERKNPVKEDSLLRKVEEYMPFGLIPVFIRET